MGRVVKVSLLILNNPMRNLSNFFAKLKKYYLLVIILNDFYGNVPNLMIDNHETYPNRLLKNSSTEAQRL